MLPDLPPPRPRTIVVVEAHVVAEDRDIPILHIRVGLAVRACAAEMATPPRERGAGAATVALKAEASATCRRLALAYRSPTLHTAWGRDDAVILPGIAAVEGLPTVQIRTIRATVTSRLGRRVATPPLEVPAIAGLGVRAVDDRATLIPSSDAPPPLGATRGAPPTRHRTQLRAPRTATTAAIVPLLRPPREVAVAPTLGATRGVPM